MPPEHIQAIRIRHFGSRNFRKCDPASLVPGDVVKGNGALWRIEAIADLKAGTYRGGDGTLHREMIHALCVDPCNSGIRLGTRKQFVLYCEGSRWERDVTEKGHQA